MKKNVSIAWVVYLAFIAAVLGVPLWINAADWSNPNPQAVGDKAGPLLLKHDLNMTDLYQASTGKLNQLKSNFAGASSPTLPNTGQSWYDSTNKLFKLYDATWGGGGFYSSGTSSFTGAILSSGTNTWSGTQNISGGISSSGTNTFSGAATFSGGLTSSGTTTISGQVASSGTVTWTGANVFSDATGTITASSLAMTGEALVSSTTNTVAYSVPGDVVAGDMIVVIAFAEIAGTTTIDQSAGANIVSSGTATGAFVNDQTSLHFSITQDAGLAGAARAFPVGIYRVTGSGTLTFTMTSYPHAGWSGLTYKSQLHVFFIKRS